MIPNRTRISSASPDPQSPHSLSEILDLLSKARRALDRTQSWVHNSPIYRKLIREESRQFCDMIVERPLA